MPASEPPAACPPPLMWQDVRGEYLEQSIKKVIGTACVRILGDGPPLYFLPGFSAPAELYCLMIWLLRDEFRCVTVEPASPVVRGSPDPAHSPTEGLTFDEQIAAAAKCSSPHPNPVPHGGEGTRHSSSNLQSEVFQLLAVADALQDERFSIFGADYGAACGLAAALARPERILRLILLQAFAHRRISMLERWLISLGTWSRRSLSQAPFRETIQTQNHRRWFPPFDQTRWQYFLEATGQMPIAELARRAQAVMRIDLREELSRIATPTLLIRTEGDGGVAERCIDELERGLPCAQTEWLHNTGHLAYLTHPHRLAKLVREFVNPGSSANRTSSSTN